MITKSRSLEVLSLLLVAGFAGADAQAPSQAELPRVLLDFEFPTVSGKTHRVGDNGNLQRALNNAQRGDEIVLAAGATFTGNFVLPTKAGTAANGWIVVRSEQLAQLPPRGTRVTAAHAVLMPKLVTPNTTPAIRTNGATSGWWLAGLEVTVSPDLTAQQYGIIWLGESGAPQTTLASVPGDLVLDRVYVHGQPTTQLSRCIALNSARTEISDSWLDECHGKGFDSQAIWGGNGPGPYKIVNNTLRGAGENIMFGGSDPAIRGLVPSDIEIRRNHIHTPIAWKGKAGGPTPWTKKNLFELKNAVRVLVEGNVLDGSWADGQNGSAVVLKSTNQSGGCRWCRTTDVTFRRNRVLNAGAGFGLVAQDAQAPVDTTLRRVYFGDNVFENIGVSPYDGIQRGIEIYGVVDATIERTLVVGNLTAAMFFEKVSTNCTFRDNVLEQGRYGLIGTGNSGLTALQRYCPTYTWSNMTFIGPSGSNMPRGTTWVGSESRASVARLIRSAVAKSTEGVVVR